MIKVELLPGAEPLIFKYVKQEFDLRDCGIELYDTYKISILLTDGIAAVLENNTVYSTLRGDILIFRPDEVHFGRILRPGFHEYIDILIPINYFDIFLPDFSSLLFPFEDCSDERINRVSPSNDAKIKVLEIAENILDIYSSKNPATEIILFSYLIELLKLCSEQYRCQAKSIYNENVCTLRCQCLHNSFAILQKNIFGTSLFAAGHLPMYSRK